MKKKKTTSRKLASGKTLKDVKPLLNPQPLPPRNHPIV